MSLGGAIFGDAKDADATQAPNQLADISKGLISETDPLRRALLQRYGAFLGAQPLPPSQTQNIRPPNISNLPNIDINDGTMNGSTSPDGNFQFRTGIGWQPLNQNSTGFQSTNSIINLNPDRPNGSSLGIGQIGQDQSNPPNPYSLVTNTPQFASLKDAINRQFSLARQNILSTTPAGGAVTRALSNLEGQRASQTASGIGGLAENELSRAFALATGTTPVALGGLGSAANSIGNIQAAQSAQQGQALQGLGMGVGSAIGRKGATSGASSAGGKSAGEAGAAAAEAL